MASGHSGRRAAGLMRHRALEVSILSGAATEQQLEHGDTHEYAHHTNHNLSHTNIPGPGVIIMTMLKIIHNVGCGTTQSDLALFRSHCAYSPTAGCGTPSGTL
jgi:hypothetical protein